jgi:site-specific DNA recombinase
VTKRSYHRRPFSGTASPRKIVGYVRVSTDEQASAGVSLDAQEARLRAYAKAMNLELDEMVLDAGASAKTLRRSGMTRILEGVRGGTIGTVIAIKLDRLTRSTRDLADLLDLFQNADAALISVSESLDTSSAAGRMVVNMLGVVSQWEREAIAERTSFALAHKRSQRKAYGTVPFGYVRIEDRLEPLLNEQEALAEMQRLDTAGASLRQIAATLNERGIRPHRGACWYASNVRAVLRSRIATEGAA